jgi:hypothetical protein
MGLAAQLKRYVRAYQSSRTIDGWTTLLSHLGQKFTDFYYPRVMQAIA